MDDDVGDVDGSARLLLSLLLLLSVLKLLQLNLWAIICLWQCFGLAKKMMLVLVMLLLPLPLQLSVGDGSRLTLGDCVFRRLAAEKHTYTQTQ